MNTAAAAAAASSAAAAAQSAAASAEGAVRSWASKVWKSKAWTDLSEKLSGQELCDRCSSIDLEWTLRGHVFDRVWDTGWRPQLSHLKDIGTLTGAERARCETCRFFWHARADCSTHGGERATYGLYFYPEQGLAPYEDFAFQSQNVRPTFYVFCKGCFPTNFLGEIEEGVEKRREYGVSGCVMTDVYNEKPSGTSAASRHVVRTPLIRPLAIDYAILRGWINQCVEKHGLKCNDSINTGPLPAHFRLVDCHDNVIVSVTAHRPYAALTYVWGRPDSREEKRDALTASGQLIVKLLPQTIRDAIEATRRLGLRYIWIDRYCVDQNDDQIKGVQINQMDLVYKRAFVTLVASAGKDDRFGLPGVGSTPRRPQAALSYGDFRLISIPPGPNDLIVSSVWAGRGWTYQEGYFSRRLLFFTKQQVYFQCRSFTNWEAIPDLRSQKRIINTSISSWSSPSWMNQLIKDYLIEYSRRDLTYGTDALPAFLGILNHFGKRSPPVKHYHGILMMLPGPAYSPYVNPTYNPYRMASQAFIDGLCWIAIPSRDCRRPYFPSWTWAGWACHLSKVGVDEKGKSLPDLMIPTVFVNQGNGRAVSLEHWLQNHNPVSRGGEILQLHAFVIPISDIRGEQFDESNHHTHSGKFGRDATFVRFPIGIIDQDRPLPQKDDELFGVVLNPVDHRFQGNEESGLFMLIMQKVGEYFERIGHSNFSSYNVEKVIQQSGGETAVEEEQESRNINGKGLLKLCTRAGERRTIRLK